MELTFLGGARTVTGSRFLLDTGTARILVDCGMFQGGPSETVRNRVPLGVDPRTLDAVVLTHAHLDHCGLLPVLVREGFRGPIVATAATASLARLVLLDSARLQEEFRKRGRRRERRDPRGAASKDARELAAFRAAVDEAVAGAASPGGPDPEDLLRAAGPVIELGLDEPLYTEDDASAALARMRAVPYDAEREVARGVHVTLLDAGHILGSAIVRVRVAAARGQRGTTIIFSGDLGRPNTPIIRDPVQPAEADFVVCESTYGGREHEPPGEAELALAGAVQDVAARRGVLLMPAFAIGRTQEVVWVLDRLLEDGAIPPLRLYLDSPMASGASDVYRAHPEAYDEETAALLASHATPLDYPNQEVVRTAEASEAIARTTPPYVIVASNGMLTGGRSVGHARRILPDPASMILFVGYQGEGTLGRHLLSGASSARIGGVEVRVRAEIRQIDGFSAHADEPELLDWLGSFVRGRRPGDRGVPKRVFLVHGDPPAQAALAPRVAALGLSPVVPGWQETVILE
jgi:metallo-beta-lactamase family protein